MRYILDDLGYIEAVSCTFIECNNKGCTEYTGAIPEGYESYAQWAEEANIRAYKIVDGNLTLDTARAAELEAEWQRCTRTNIMTIGLAANKTFTVSTAWAYTKLVCDTLQLKLGNKLTFENGAIKIGEGVKYVKISANAMTNGVANYQIVNIALNGTYVSTGYYRATNASYYGTIGLTPVVIEVAEGDEISLTYGTGATGSLVIAGGTCTYLTVEVIE